MAGTYSIEVNDANGCTALAAATVQGSAAVAAQADVAEPLCHASMDGSIHVTAIAGQAPFTYTWGDGSSNPTIINASAGVHSITVTDANGCTWDSLITITAPPPLTAMTPRSPTMLVATTSAIGVEMTAAFNYTWRVARPYTYAWGDGNSNRSAVRLLAGSYSVLVTDANGCSLALTIQLDQPDGLEMPSGFTPNGDGSNDAFIVHGIDAFPESQLTVFNRMGQRSVRPAPLCQPMAR